MMKYTSEILLVLNIFVLFFWIPFCYKKALIKLNILMCLFVFGIQIKILIETNSLIVAIAFAGIMMGINIAGGIHMGRRAAAQYN